MRSSAESDSPLRVGILGCSDIARRKFIPALLACDRAILSAVAGRNRQKSQGFAAGPSCRVMELVELVAAPGIDLLYISLPNHLHEEWTLRALAAGKHVICEKPLGLSADSVERMLRSAEERGLLLFENLMFLYHPQHALVKGIIERGIIGRLRSVRTVFGIPSPGQDNFRLDPASGGGAFNDMSRYPLATALFFLSDDRLRFRGFSLNRNGLNCTVNGSAVNAAGEMFTYSMAFGQQYECFYEIVGEGGKITLDRAFTPPPDLVNAVRVITPGGEALHEVPSADHFLCALESVVAMVRSRTGFSGPHQRSRTIARLSDEMKKGCVNVEIRC